MDSLTKALDVFIEKVQLPCILWPPLDLLLPRLVSVPKAVAGSRRVAALAQPRHSQFDQ